MLRSKLAAAILLLLIGCASQVTAPDNRIEWLFTHGFTHGECFDGSTVRVRAAHDTLILRWHLDWGLLLADDGETVVIDVDTSDCSVDYDTITDSTVWLSYTYTLRVEDEVFRYDVYRDSLHVDGSGE